MTHGEPTARRIVAEVRWLAVGQGASQLSWYAMVLVLAALLPPAAFGTVAAGVAVVTVATLLMQSGTGGSIIAARRLDARELRGAVALNVGLGVAFTAVIALLAGPLVEVAAEGGDATVLRVLAVGVTLAALTVVPQAVLRRALNFKRLAGVKAGTAVATSLAAIAAAVLGAGVWALVVRHVLFQGLVAALSWLAARRTLAELDREAPEAAPERPRGRLAFFIVALSGFTALSFDTLLVGGATDATRLGFYALAFTLAFAPLTQFSWQLGQVLFPAAAATRDLQAVGRRTLRIVRVTALLLFPLVPPAVVLAPVLIPTVLGEEWRPMITPFQILLSVGVAHAVTNTIGESLSGTGNISFRAWVESLWAVGTVGGVFLLVQAEGIRGAALAHLLLFFPLAAAYVLQGLRRIGTSPGALWAELRDVVIAVAVQAGVTGAIAAGLGAQGVGDAVTAVIAALLGLGAALGVLLIAPSRPLQQGRQVFGMVVSRAAPAGSRS